MFIELVRTWLRYREDHVLLSFTQRQEADFVLRQGTHIESLVQVCYDMSSLKTEKREVDAIVECAGELKCDNLTIVTYDDERTIEKDGYKMLFRTNSKILIDVVNHRRQLQ